MTEYKIRIIYPGCYAVDSIKADICDTYYVDLKVNGIAHCTCKSFYYRNKVGRPLKHCKHIKEILRLLYKEGVL